MTGASEATPLLRARGLRKAFGGTPVFEDFGLDVAGGDIVALVGPNGAGKSTLLACLAGAAPLDEGTIAIAGEPSDPSSAAHWKAVFGVLDDFTWLPDLTIADHLTLMSPERAARPVRAALDTFGIAGLADRLPASLSAGQRQRAALATALVRPWRVLLLDEPEQHLDARGVDGLADRLAALAGPDRCVLLSTHAPALLARLGCRSVALGAGPAA
ncbi:ABC transporter ATP-binding protein [Streptomyces marincola]|uniref:ABC transporter ATP-binding protein n=1 Tax=Streptomyces marincola TaxID=2878388 RepID=UPI00131EC8DB|nr:ABC transporter ATP-binding protein [Streptomyces marincola]